MISLENGLLLVILFFLVLIVFWNLNIRYYFGLPGLRFKENEYLSIDMFPYGRESVFLFSCDDLSGKTDPKDVIMVRNLLDKYNIKGTFFAIPDYKGRYKLNESVLNPLLENGHEIAQHGLTHEWKRARGLPILGTLEFRGLDKEEQETRISEGSRILAGIGVEPVGFRTAHFSSNEKTLDLLIKAGFLYNSDVRIRPEGKITNKRFLGIVYGSVYFPYFWETRNGRILIIPANGDYTWGLKTGIMNKTALKIALNRLNKYHSKQGVFCMLTHLHPRALPRPRSMKFIESFFQHVKDKDTWAPTMGDFARWWDARTSLKVTTYHWKGELVIRLEKPSVHALDGLVLRIKHKGPYLLRYDLSAQHGNGPEDVTIQF